MFVVPFVGMPFTSKTFAHLHIATVPKYRVGWCHKARNAVAAAWQAMIQHSEKIYSASLGILTCYWIYVSVPVARPWLEKYVQMRFESDT
eukprot:1672556-Amphidinium_carterae.1